MLFVPYQHNNTHGPSHKSFHTKHLGSSLTYKHFGSSFTYSHILFVQIKSINQIHLDTWDMQLPSPMPSKNWWKVSAATSGLIVLGLSEAPKEIPIITEWTIIPNSNTCVTDSKPPLSNKETENETLIFEEKILVCPLTLYIYLFFFIDLES